MGKKITDKTLVIAVSILIIAMPILLIKIYKVDTSVETIKNDNLTEKFYETKKHLNLLELYVEEKFTGLEDRLPKQDLEQFISTSLAEQDRIEDLLNKISGLETVHGVIIGINKTSPISLDVILTRPDADGNYNKTKENIKIILDQNYTPYMAGQLTLAPISKNEFIKVVEGNLKNKSQEGFTFKTVNGKAVQIYEGYID